jgi:LacI family transcriptional regulator
MAQSLKSVAKKAGVSISTVNQILNGYTDRFAEETCILVQQTAAKIGYKPNLAARALRQKKSFLIGVLFSDINAPLFSDFTRGVMKGLGNLDYSPIVMSGRDTREEAVCLDRCLHRRVDGLIINTTIDSDGSTNAEYYAELLSSGMPMVEVFGSFLQGVPKVNADFYAASQRAVEYLVSQGHRSIALLTHDQYKPTNAVCELLHRDAFDQYSGYVKAMHDAGQTPAVYMHTLGSAVPSGENFISIGLNALDELISAENRPTAVICYNDDIAWGVTQACHKRGISVPADLSVVGYGDDRLARISLPLLTTFRRPVIDTAENATRLLIRAIGGDGAEDVILLPELILRESTAQLR